MVMFRNEKSEEDNSLLLLLMGEKMKKNREGVGNEDQRVSGRETWHFFGGNKIKLPRVPPSFFSSSFIPQILD